MIASMDVRKGNGVFGGRLLPHALVLCLGVGLSLWSTGLSEEFISMSRVAPQPVRATACPMPVTRYRDEIAALARDIGRRFHLARSAAESITSAAFRAAQARGVDPTLVLAVAAVESKFHPRAVNAVTGATGLMQVVPKWHPVEVVRAGGEPSLLLVAPNLTVGTAILAEYVDAEDGDVAHALGRYLGAAGEQYVNRVRREMAHFTKVRQTI